MISYSGSTPGARPSRGREARWIGAGSRVGELGSLVQGSAERRVTTAGRRLGERRGHRAAGRWDDRGAVGRWRAGDAAARRQRRQGVRADPGRPRRLLRAAGRRGPRARRRERLRQDDGGQDPQRRPHPGRRRDRARGRARPVDQDAARGAEPRHLHGLPGGPRRRVLLGARQRLARRRRHVAHARGAAREGRSREADARRAARPRGRPAHGGRGALAVRSPGLRDRARARARPEDPDPRRGDLRARRRHARPPVRDRRQPLATRRRRDLHHAPHGRDRADRRPHHRDALRRDRGRARSRQLDAPAAGAADDRLRGARQAGAGPAARRSPSGAARRC